MGAHRRDPEAYVQVHVRLYHPLEVDAMKKVLRKRKLKGQAQKTAMWDNITAARKEILEQQSEVPADV